VTVDGLQMHEPGALLEILAGTAWLNTDAGGAGGDFSICVTGAELYFGANQHLDTLALDGGALARLTGANVVVVKHLLMDGIDLGAVTLTPEPVTLALPAAGGLGLLNRRSRRKSGRSGCSVVTSCRIGSCRCTRELTRITVLPLTRTTECRILMTVCRVSVSTLRTPRMKQPPLANAELAIMDLLWQEDRLTARQVREQLYPNAAKAQHGTVQRLLQRLEDKGYVERDRSQPVLFFSAVISRQAYACSQLESLAARLTGGSLAPLITHLVEEKRISREEIRRLRAILDGRPGDGGQA
jgi:BlaI family penicillinase repressor